LEIPRPLRDFLDLVEVLGQQPSEYEASHALPDKS
jgi:hypothetical protein